MALSDTSSAERVILFASTHGYADTKHSDLVLSDSYFSGKVLKNSLPLAEIEDRIRESSVREVITLIDACHSGAVGQTFYSGGELPPLRDGEPEMQQVFFQSSSSFTQSSEEEVGPCGGHGVYTCALLKAMEGAADQNGDGGVTLGELQSWIPTWVWRRTQQRQSPQTLGRFSHDLVFTLDAISPTFWIRQGEAVPDQDAGFVSAVSGGAEVWMVDARGRSIALGKVHAGTYRIMARFESGVLGSYPLEVLPRDSVTIHCDARAMSCTLDK